MGSPSHCTNLSPGFTFAPLLAIALDRQALLVPLHPDHAWLLGKLRQGDALCQDHMDLPSFHVQLLPLPDVDILHRQSRHDINASISGGQKEKPTSLKQREGTLFLPLAFLPTCTVPSVTCLVSLPALQGDASYHLIFSFESGHYPPVNDAVLLLIMWGNHSSFL